ncbi:MAG: MBL fold hydrolase [Flavobacterium sp.]|nr:MBL fold hydrolase [Flavobacterium sp.]
MKIAKFIFNIFAVNTFIVWDETSKDAFIIDPGVSLPEEEKEIKDFITRENLTIKYFLNTHCHIDHIFGNAFIKENYSAKFLAPEGDVFLLDLMVDHAGDFGVTMKPSPKPDVLIRESLIINLGDISVRFISTPGHTPDGYCVYFENEKICFTGDTLFNESIGRTDLWGGNYEALIDSIRMKLLVLPQEVRIYSGHGDESTIGYEKNNNPFLT